MKRKAIFKITRTVCAAVIAVATLYSCTLESANAGDFDGMWHLTNIDTLATGGTRNMSKELIFWSFENKLMEADDKSGGNQSVLFRFNQSENTITLSSPYAYDRNNGDQALTDSTLLLPFGINKIEESFLILKNKGSRLELQSATLKLSFKRM